MAPGWPDDASWPSVPSHHRLHRLLMAMLVFLLVAGGVSGALVIFLRARGTGDVLVKMAPNDSALYIGVYLDPPAGQKTNLNVLLHRFPDVRDDQQRDRKINGVLDDALSQSHLTHDDVKSWLGSQISLVASADMVRAVGRGTGVIASMPPPPGKASIVAHGAGTLPVVSRDLPFAILISATDDKKAQTTLDAFRHGSDGRRYDWTDESYDGVALARGMPMSGNGTPLVYSIVDHAVVIGASSVYTDEIIDTALGKHPALDDSSRYRKVVTELPVEHLASAYIDLKAMIQQLPGQLTHPRVNGPGGTRVPQQPVGLDALQGMGVALSAESNGVMLNATADFDPSKLTAEQRRLVTGGGGGNRTLSLVPDDAYGFFGVTGIDRSARSALDAFSGMDPQIGHALDNLNLTGVDGLLSHLTGEAAVEAAPREASPLPGGTLLLGGNDDSAMATTLGKLADMAAQATGPDRQPSGSIGDVPGALRPLSPSSSPPAASSPSPLSSGTSPASLSPPTDSGPDGTGLSQTPSSALLARVGASAAPATVAGTPTPVRARPTPTATPYSRVLRPTPVPTPTPAPAPAPAPAQPDLTVHHVQSTYRGVVITTAQMASSDPNGPLPSYAVSRGIGILGTDPAAVRAALDAQAGMGITSTRAYRDAAGQLEKDSGDILYVDISAVTAAVRDNLSPSERADFDHSVAPDLTPVKTLVISGRGGADHSTLRLFVGIG